MNKAKGLADMLGAFIDLSNETKDTGPPMSMRERYIIITSKLKNKFRRKYKYRVVAINTTKESLHEMLLKYGNFGYRIIHVHYKNDDIIEYTFEKQTK